MCTTIIYHQTIGFLLRKVCQKLVKSLKIVLSYPSQELHHPNFDKQLPDKHIILVYRPHAQPKIRTLIDVLNTS
jgi:hypothetical protein